MTTINQLVRNPRVPKPVKTKLLALKFSWNSLRKKWSFLNSPQRLGICKGVGTTKPVKPNSGNRPKARVLLKNWKEVNAYIPGEGHNLREFSAVLISGRGAKDLHGVKYRVIRGYKDAGGVKNRRQGRSLSGTKKPKPIPIIKLNDKVIS